MATSIARRNLNSQVSYAVRCCLLLAFGFFVQLGFICLPNSKSVLAGENERTAESQVSEIVTQARKTGELSKESAKRLVDLIIANPSDVSVVVGGGRGLKVDPEIARPEVVRLVESFELFNERKRDIIEIIGACGAAPDQAIPILTEELKSSSTVTSNKAIVALASMSIIHDKDIQPTLDIAKERIESGSFGDTDIYGLAVAIKGKAAVLLPSIEPLLVKTLQSQYPSASLMRALAHMGPAAESVSPILIEALPALPDNGFDFACETIAKIGAHEDRLVAKIAPMLENESRSRKLLETLADFPAAAAKSTHLIDQLLADSPEDNPEAVVCVMGACGEVGRKKYAKLLKEIADLGDYSGRVASQSLLRLYPDHPAGVAYCLKNIGGFSDYEKRKLRRWLADDLEKVLRNAAGSADPLVQKYGRDLAVPPPPSFE